MSLSKQDLAYYKNKVLLECKFGEIHFEITRLYFGFDQQKRKKVEELSKMFKRPVVKIDDAVMFTTYKIKSFLRKEDLSEEEIEEVLWEIFD
jgi:tRNA(Arg) A34 adenosine deaminase TadA